jgi:hypothetical protein
MSSLDAPLPREVTLEVHMNGPPWLHNQKFLQGLYLVFTDRAFIYCPFGPDYQRGKQVGFAQGITIIEPGHYRLSSQLLKVMKVVVDYLEETNDWVELGELRVGEDKETFYANFEFDGCNVIGGANFSFELSEAPPKYRSIMSLPPVSETKL